MPDLRSMYFPKNGVCRLKKHLKRRWLTCVFCWVYQKHVCRDQSGLCFVELRRFFVEYGSFLVAFFHQICLRSLGKISNYAWHYWEQKKWSSAWFPSNARRTSQLLTKDERMSIKIYVYFVKISCLFRRSNTWRLFSNIRQSLVGIFVRLSLKMSISLWRNFYPKFMRTWAAHLAARLPPFATSGQKPATV